LKRKQGRPGDIIQLPEPPKREKEHLKRGVDSISAEMQALIEASLRRAA
jgi:hypothetical protein